MSQSFRNCFGGAAIIGIGESDLGNVPDKSSHALHAQAANAALADAGLDKSAIDGLITCDSYTTKRTRHAVNLGQYIGLRSEQMRYVGTNMHGSTAASGATLQEAAILVQAGYCDYVLVVGGDNWYTERERMIQRIAENRDAEFENPYGTFIPACFGMIANRYKHDYGITDEQLAEIPVAQRHWATLTPNGHMRHKRITRDEVMASPLIATPHRRLNCALLSDGAAAFIVTSAERAREHGHRAVTIVAGETTYGSGSGIMSDDIGQLQTLYSVREGARDAINRAYRKAGMTVNDIDIFYCYDPFSFMPCLYFEAFGLCKDGEGAAFAGNGRIAPGGATPWNTHGGLHSYCHSGVGGGLFHQIEAVRQLRREAGPRQIADAETAMMIGEGSNWGSFPATIFLRGQL